MGPLHEETQLEFWEEWDRYGEFREFHRDNPQVFDLFLKFSNQALSAGRTRFSAYCVAERIRWFTWIETSDPEFKLNNNHIPFYSRLVMLVRPELFEGFFKLRGQKYAVSDEVLLRECG
jgi:hypothetical protein